MSKILIEASKEDEGLRADVMLSKHVELYTRSFLSSLFDEGKVSVNEKQAAKGLKIKAGDIMCAHIPDPAPLDVEAQDIPLDVVYEDDDLIVINKSAGMIVHPSGSVRTGTLVNALLSHSKDNLSQINGVFRPGIVHRIDKDTSGLIMAAKNNFAHLSLSNQLKDHSINRVYEAITLGAVRESGTVDAPIGRSKLNRKKMCVTNENSKNAVTHYELIKELNGASLIKCVLETGRTHQIRVHMAHIGRPIVGDGVYGPKKPKITAPRQMLHARTLGFVHPKGGEYMEFDAPPPPDFLNLLTKLEIRQ